MCNNYLKQACVLEKLEAIFQEQLKVKQHDVPCEQRHFQFPDVKIKNTIPFLLYIDGQPFQVEGVTICVDPHDQIEKFVCFKTFLFRLISLDGNCALLELLKFRHRPQEKHCEQPHTFSPCCQTHCQEVENLFATGVCITVDATVFHAIQSLPAVSL